MLPVIPGKPCHTVEIQVSVCGSKQCGPPGKRFTTLRDLHPAFFQACVTHKTLLSLSQYSMCRFINISILY
jgi:hypothetical protein